MKTYRFGRIINRFAVIAAFMAMAVPALAQEGDSFEDDPFSAQQNSMRRSNRRNGGSSQWRPSTYADQAAMLQTMANAKIRRSLIYEFGTEGVLSDGQNAPFWFTSNRQGMSSFENKSLYGHFATMGHMLLPSRFGMGYGMDLGLAEGLQQEWFVQQMYIDLDYKCLQFSIGSKERWGELANPELSSGSLTWSGNSKPVPQARFGIPEFTAVPILGSWFSVKGHVAYGMYTDSRWRSQNAESAYTDGVRYHSKALFVRFGKEERFPLYATLGLEMYSQFGGTMHNRKFRTDDELMEEYTLPQNLKAYWNILLPFNGVGAQTQENGNSLGSWHLSFDYLGKEWRARAYYEHFYEDHSGMLGIEYKNDLEGNRDYVFYGFRRNWFDGLWGLEFNMPEYWPVRDAVFEVLNTRGQSGPVYRYPKSSIAEGVDGRDGMYTHEIYDSYSHWGYAEGSPLLLSPIYNADSDQRFKSNRVLAFHAGLDGSIGARIDWKVLLTGTRHWGTYEMPYNEVEDITSCMISGYYLFEGTYGWKLGLSVGFDLDSGSTLGDNRGIMLSISRRWKIL